ncbi:MULTISPECIES: tail fiber assembly protein [unclassified Gilliamella]|uniref:tail fiber assembly protein n=1 Tax=unclassified Gilliamella TaxID=2685620 RepID=UPI002269A537|nr:MULTISPECIES: tail fiber assembly protein [unclassified Gilliamella]MCX8601446.1 tail fiber assembly protein [Gilliamella sp. B3722]MCX8607220.1 tail fiber assembly protein [Gilliamella sp. B3771]MCX8610584.1 tail fiber assembly protein [Gilliamella sp. B3891]MCX8613177.1 tail fiber assembly protein [Gilliamella sp. B3773]MCX8615899.1 tail fiber assembly protein [Gilliamella sp. B3770]
MINYYYDNTNDLKPFTHQLEANDDTLPPDNALRLAPEFKDGLHPCENNGKWVLVEDNREKTAYNIETKEAVNIDYLGQIKEGFTLLEPFEFCKWNGEEWVHDEEAENEQMIKNNQALRNTLLNEANDKIAILQDIIDLDMQENDEEAQLKKWKKYRILLTRLDTSDINVVFPSKPE